MPTYDYECSACGHTLEIFQSITASPKRKCPQCGKQKLKRLLGSGAGFIFRGSGFYETDYRSSDYKKREKADSEAASGTKGEGAKSDGTKSNGAKSGGETSGTSSGGGEPKKSSGSTSE